MLFIPVRLLKNLRIQNWSKFLYEQDVYIHAELLLQARHIGFKTFTSFEPPHSLASHCHSRQQYRYEHRPTSPCPRVGHGRGLRFGGGCGGQLDIFVRILVISRSNQNKLKILVWFWEYFKFWVGSKFLKADYLIGNLIRSAKPNAFPWVVGFFRSGWTVGDGQKYFLHFGSLS